MIYRSYQQKIEQQKLPKSIKMLKNIELMKHLLNKELNTMLGKFYTKNRLIVKKYSWPTGTQHIHYKVPHSKIIYIFIIRVVLRKTTNKCSEVIFIPP